MATTVAMRAMPSAPPEMAQATKKTKSMAKYSKSRRFQEGRCLLGRMAGYAAASIKV